MGYEDAQSHFLKKQVNVFLFDLKNEAIEHGFKPDEYWELQMTTEAEVSVLKKHHYPVISLRLQPNALLKVYQQVKCKLQQSLSKGDIALTEIDLTRDEKNYLTAYPVRGIRK